MSPVPANKINVQHQICTCSWVACFCVSCGLVCSNCFDFMPYFICKSYSQIKLLFTNATICLFQLLIKGPIDSPLAVCVNSCKLLLSPKHNKTYGTLLALILHTGENQSPFIFIVIIPFVILEIVQKLLNFRSQRPRPEKCKAVAGQPAKKWAVRC